MKSLRINFEDYQHLFEAGFKTGEINFVDKLNTIWLETYPNDLHANINRAEFLVSKLMIEDSVHILENIISSDPENIEAYRKIIRLSPRNLKEYNSALYVLSGESQDINSIYPWAVTLRSVKIEIKRNNFTQAKKLLTSAISNAPNNILIALEHLRLSQKIEDTESTIMLSRIYQERWKQCLQFNILSAIEMMKTGEENKAVTTLHACVNQDPGGVVAKRLLGENHEFLSVWPKKRSIECNLQIPPTIAVSLNWNKLKPGDIDQSRKNIIDKSLSKESSKKARKKHSSKSAPVESNKVYIILSSNAGLQKKYGPKSAEIIKQHLNTLSSAVDRRPGWESHIFIPDDADYVSKFGLQPITENNPWKFKLSIMDLNKDLARMGKSINALVIIGNDEVIPFHRLPNPTDDSDSDVLSDNPYATDSSNYLLPLWTIGRIPGEKGNDPGLLLEQIRHITKFHNNGSKSENFFETIKNRLLNIFDIRRIIRNLFYKPREFGYSAEVWRRSSIAAFRPIGKGADLRVSPPFDNETIDIDNLMKAKCAYFNLHGLSNTPEWYGQKDFSESSEGPDFPVAISASKINKHINNIDLVFTEACYGGYIINKTIEDSIAMKLISIGSQGVVGSTCISYGSIFTPLIGGDLLGFIFWKYIKDGYSFGLALQQAKIGLVKILMQRQGYLDGEDQKTLLSFVLYGDPLGCLEETIYADEIKESISSENKINLVNDSDGVLSSPSNISEKISKDIGELLQSYVPGLESADIKVRKHKISIQKMVNNGQNKNDSLGTNLGYKNLTQIFYNKSIISEKRKHTQYARVTMDDSGKITKLVVSR